MGKLVKGITVFVFVAVAASMAQAGPPLPDVPEIDPSVASSALTLLVGGVMILAAKLRR